MPNFVSGSSETQKLRKPNSEGQKKIKCLSILELFFVFVFGEFWAICLTWTGNHESNTEITNSDAWLLFNAWNIPILICTIYLQDRYLTDIFNALIYVTKINIYRSLSKKTYMVIAFSGDIDKIEVELVIRIGSSKWMSQVSWTIRVKKCTCMRSLALGKNDEMEEIFRELLRFIRIFSLSKLKNKNILCLRFPGISIGVMKATQHHCQIQQYLKYGLSLVANL